MNTPWPVVLWRLLRLAGWLAATGVRLRGLARLPEERRLAVLREMGAGCLKILNVRVRASPAPETVRGTLVAANHVSWLDIFVLVSLYPGGFIAMKELRGWPLIGRMIANAGTVFIDRSNRRDVDSVNAAIVAALQDGGNVCFFPESKTSSGLAVLPLKAALFEAAVQAAAPVRAVALRYYDGTGARTARVSFAGVNLWVSLWRIVRLREIAVRADLAAPMLADGGGRFALKERVQDFLNGKVAADSPQ